MFRTLIVALMVGMLVGCTHVLWVKEKEGTSDYEKVPGVPFYAKKETFRHTSVYVKSWLRATLTVEKKAVDKKAGNEAPADSVKQVFTKDLLKGNAGLLTPIKTGIIDANLSSVDEAQRLIKLFNQLPGIADDSTVTAVLVKNTVESEWVVDSSKRYYLNAPLPWFGTGNLTQELNSDGTLAKATSNPDTKLMEGISGLIPFKEYLSGKFVKPGASAATDSNTKADTEAGFRALRQQNKAFKRDDGELVYLLSIAVEEAGHEYTLTSKPSDTWPASETEIPFADKNALVTRKDLSAGDKAEDKKEEGAKIGINGSIQFPKDWPAVKAPEK